VLLDIEFNLSRFPNLLMPLNGVNRLKLTHNKICKCVERTKVVVTRETYYTICRNFCKSLFYTTQPRYKRWQHLLRWKKIFANVSNVIACKLEKREHLSKFLFCKTFLQLLYVPRVTRGAARVSRTRLRNARYSGKVWPPSRSSALVGKMLRIEFAKNHRNNKINIYIVRISQFTH